MSSISIEEKQKSCACSTCLCAFMCECQTERVRQRMRERNGWPFSPWKETTNEEKKKDDQFAVTPIWLLKPQCSWTSSTAFKKVDKKTYYQFYWQIKSIQNRFWYLRLFYGVFKSTCFSMLATSRTLVKLQKFWNILLQVKLHDL